MELIPNSLPVNSQTGNSENHSQANHSSFSLLLKPVYIKLAQLTARINKQQLDSNTIRELLSLCEDLIALGKSHPNQLFAQLQLNKPSLPYAINLIANHAIFTLLMALRNQWNESAIQQLIACSISELAIVASDIEELSAADAREVKTKYAKKLGKLLLTTKTLKLEIWEKSLKGSNQRILQMVKFRRVSEGKCPASFILSFSSCIAHLITKGKNKKPVAFGVAFRKISQQSSPRYMAMLEPLVSFPSIYPPGSIVKKSDGSFWLVLSLCQKSVLTKQFDAKSGKCSDEISELKTTEIAQSLSPQQLKHLSKLDDWWDEQWQETLTSNLKSEPLKIRATHYRLDKPPPTLLAIQSHLHDDNFDVNELSRLIASEPVFAEHVKNTASHSAREELKITDVKHGLMMHGFERTSNLLMQHALIVRLNQHYFPLQGNIVQFSKLTGHIASIIADSSPVFSNEQAGCWASFASSGLFTNIELKSRTKLNFNNKQGMGIGGIFDLTHPELLTKHAVKLSESWQQEKAFILALRNLEIEIQNKLRNSTAHKITALLGLTFIVAKLIYFAEASPSSKDTEWFNLCQSLLNLKNHSLDELIIQAIEDSHCYCELAGH